MPSFLKIRGYVFETEALKDAYLALPPSARSTTTGYDEDALRGLLRYFADWGPVREESLTASPADSLESLSTDQKRDLYNELTKRLSENLAEQYNRDVDQRAFEGFLHRIADETLPEPLATFFLRYLWRASKRIHEYEQGFPSSEQQYDDGESTDEASSDEREFVAAIHRLPSEYLDQKRTQYEGDDKINRVRFQALETIRSDGSLSIERLQELQQAENEKHDAGLR